MDIDIFSIYAILASFFGGLGLSVNEHNKSNIMNILMISGLLALILCTFTVLGKMASQHCELYKSLCEIDSFYMNKINFPSDNEEVMVKLFFASGWWGSLSLYAILVLAHAKEKTYKILSFIGATTLALLTASALYAKIIA